MGGRHRHQKDQQRRGLGAGIAPVQRRFARRLHSSTTAWCTTRRSASSPSRPSAGTPPRSAPAPRARRPPCAASGDQRSRPRSPASGVAISARARRAMPVCPPVSPGRPDAWRRTAPRPPPAARPPRPARPVRATPARRASHEVRLHGFERLITATVMAPSSTAETRNSASESPSTGPGMRIPDTTNSASASTRGDEAPKARRPGRWTRAATSPAPRSGYGRYPASTPATAMLSTLAPSARMPPS